MMPRRPRTTLFPYTTLFRSPVNARGDAAQNVISDRSGEPGVFPGDRKSTRLNSSHVKISYAVFCLKKKNTIARAGIWSFALKAQAASKAADAEPSIRRFALP